MIFNRLTLMRCFGNLAVGQIFAAIFIIQLLGCGSQDKEEAQKPENAQNAPSSAPTAAAKESKPLNTVESLVAPIALYPDPLLAELLVASTYPLEIVQAARWLETKPDLDTLPSKDWDASVARLTAIPAVVKMMNDHLDWTTQLGNAFLEDPKEIMDAVQALRKRAVDGGFLKDSDQLKVSEETVASSEPSSSDETGSEVKAVPAVLTKEVITIQPAKEDTLSVPSYNPEVVYSAPLAPPPATTAGYGTAYPTAVAPAPAYYPVYTAPPATTTSSSDEWLSFGMGAVAGGLLTWGIMEWADDDDDYYHVGHYHGDTVCHNGNCWSGGGGGNYNRENNVNISGNEININRDKTFKEKDLERFGDRDRNRDRNRANGWQPDPRHRRGQAYPAKAQNRLGKIQQPALPGNRLPNAKTMPANQRGFDAGSREQKRLSTAEIERQLKAKPSKDSLRQDKMSQARRDNAFQGLDSSNRELNRERQRGSSSLQQTKDRGTTRKSAKTSSLNQGARINNKPAQQIKRSQQSRPETQTRRQAQNTRPNAFESARSPQQSSTFGRRGSESRNRSQAFGGSASNKANRQMGGNRGGGSQRQQRAGGGGRGGGGGRRR